MRRRILGPIFLLLFSLVLLIGVPVVLLLIALSNAIDASPQPMIAISCVFGAFLILLLLYMARHLRKLRKRQVRGLTYSDSYLDVAELRSEVTLAGGMAINLLYAIFKFGTAMYYHTLLFAAEAFYYLVLSVIRMLLVLSAYAGRRSENGLQSSWKSYRRCGWQLLILELSMTFVILQSLLQNDDYVNLTAVTLISAIWASFRLITAIVQLIKFRGVDRPMISASKLINLSAALMSLYILQNMLLLHFGNPAFYRRVISTIFGIAISLTVILIALFMVVHGTKKLRAVKQLPEIESSTDPL